MSADHNNNNNKLLLQLFSDWTVCDGCGLPPTATHHNKPLSVCRNCKSAAYHTVDCQKKHWTAISGGHRTECQKLSAAMRPLLRLQQLQLQQAAAGGRRNDINTTAHCRLRRMRRLVQEYFMKKSSDESVWQASVQQWNRQEYLEAMRGFQTSLQPLMERAAWTTAMLLDDDDDDDNCDTDAATIAALEPTTTTTKTTTIDDTTKRVMTRLAKRLLFCAYCEADAQQVASSRSKLVQCLSILLLLQLRLEYGCQEEEAEEEKGGHSSSNDITHNNNNNNNNNKAQKEDEIDEVLDDAWMELMLSFDEDELCRRLTRHVANLAITSGSSCCGWKHPLQRPGYMAAIDIVDDDHQNNYCPSFIPRDRHPEWCAVLEDSWESIAQELFSLETTQKRQCWGAVGSGERGSGSDDHRVVSAGGNWKEYVLFGTGSAVGVDGDDSDAPITKRLLREHVPMAVSLAEAGGGEVIFSRLAPGTRIEAHCGPTNLRWTAHLGLVVPAQSSGNCQIRVASTWYQWERGKILLFDDSYEHEIHNDTTEVRTVLLLRLWHPALGKERRMVELNEAQRRKEIAVQKRYHPPA